MKKIRELESAGKLRIDTAYRSIYVFDEMRGCFLFYAKYLNRKDLISIVNNLF